MEFFGIFGYRTLKKLVLHAQVIVLYTYYTSLERKLKELFIYDKMMAILAIGIVVLLLKAPKCSEIIYVNSNRAHQLQFFYSNTKFIHTL
jgi:hypothetical protein